MMAEEEKTNIKEKVEKKKDIKNTSEDKVAVVKTEEKETAKQNEKNKQDSVKEKSEPAMEKSKVQNLKPKKKDIKTSVVELEREYIVPMRKGFLNVPHYRRAKKAVKTLKEFMVRHMNIRDGDTRKVKVDINLNNEIWFRGIRNPLHKIKVKAVKKNGIVVVTLADPSDYVKFKMAREAKAKKIAEAGKEKPKAVKKEKVDDDKDKDGVSDKKEESEDKKAGAEKAAKNAKVKDKALKHTASGKHAQKVAPVRKVLK